MRICPGTSKPLEEREEFWADVKDILAKCDKNKRIVILGHFNGWVGIQRDGYEIVLVVPPTSVITKVQRSFGIKTSRFVTKRVPLTLQTFSFDGHSTAKLRELVSPPAARPNRLFLLTPPTDSTTIIYNKVEGGPFGTALRVRSVRRAVCAYLYSNTVLFRLSFISENVGATVYKRFPRYGFRRPPPLAVSPALRNANVWLKGGGATVKSGFSQQEGVTATAIHNRTRQVDHKGAYSGSLVSRLERQKLFIAETKGHNPPRELSCNISPQEPNYIKYCNLTKRKCKHRASAILSLVAQALARYHTVPVN
ncbi:hypothetical protein EVAR_64291_1 [Eumeta japonica]|uniref:Uncharacterized protein n=1 Tax=Eumeta variegata TaxID=151549 RepID=A0A4C2A545_EUMVA|nr:hypothetical protein EVAR_64291_1 [Eumeta japonica]